MRGFIAGLSRTRRGLEMENELGDDRPGVPDPFMYGYREGYKVREAILDEACSRVNPQLSSSDRLQALVEAAEQFLAEIEVGNGFTTTAIANEVARARVHLADYGGEG